MCIYNILLFSCSASCCCCFSPPLAWGRYRPPLAHMVDPQAGVSGAETRTRPLTRFPNTNTSMVDEVPRHDQIGVSAWLPHPTVLVWCHYFSHKQNLNRITLSQINQIHQYNKDVSTCLAVATEAVWTQQRTRWIKYKLNKEAGCFD